MAHSTETTDGESVGIKKRFEDNGSRHAINGEAAYVAPVHKKTPQQIAAIQGRMKGNWMFEALNPKDEKSILDAVVPVVKKQGDVII